MNNATVVGIQNLPAIDLLTQLLMAGAGKLI